MSLKCNDCTLCCTSAMSIPMSDADDPNDYIMEERDGQQLVALHLDGHTCIHLVDGKCEVYDNRPEVCRSYDCRGLAFGRETTEMYIEDYIEADDNSVMNVKQIQFYKEVLDMWAFEPRHKNEVKRRLKLINLSDDYMLFCDAGGHPLNAPEHAIQGAVFNFR